MKRILVAIDMTDGSGNALGRALRLAQTTGASLRVLHAVPSPAFDMEPSAVRRLVCKAVAEMVEALPAPHPDVTIRISSLHKAEAILNSAQRFGADLIVLGGHAEPRFRDAIFGTTATHVVRHAVCPVLVAQSDPTKPYHTAMLALSGVEEGKALHGVTDVLAPGAALTGVNAFDPSMGKLFGRRVALEKEARDHAKALGTALPGVKPLVETGDPLTVLMDQARELDPDLVVMGTSQRAYLNSYAVDALFWCERDLLIVPSPRRPVAAAPGLGGAVFA